MAGFGDMSGLVHGDLLHKVAVFKCRGIGSSRPPVRLHSIGRRVCINPGWHKKGGSALEKPDFIVVVKGDEIIVRTLGFYATYYKAHGQPQLILRERTKTDDQELVAEAMKAANDKARELGWIV
jgi:hypothetical protein